MRIRATSLSMIAVLATFMSAQFASAESYPNGSRMELYDAQARAYVDGRMRTVESRTRYVQPRVQQMRVVMPTPSRTVYSHGPAGPQPQVYRTASYHDPETVTVVEEAYPDDSVILDQAVADGDPGVVQQTYVQTGNVEPAYYAGYRPVSSCNTDTVVVYRPYPVYQTRVVYHDYPRYYYPRHHYPSYRVGVYYGHPGYPGRYWGHHRPHYGGYGHYGHYRGRCDSDWGFSFHIRF